MGRLIDADVFKERLMANIGLTNCLDRSFKETPTIDAVEVVRCKRCKYEKDGYCINQNHKVMPMHYCSYGKHKETDHE